jgi:hypothetical protein
MATKKTIEAFAKTSDKDGTRDRDKALFAALLWYATSNNVVSIVQSSSGTTSTIKQKNTNLSEHADKFGVLAPPDNFKTAVTWLEDQISQKDSLRSYKMADFNTGQLVTARINVGVAFDVVATVFNMFSRLAILGQSDYDPNDNCLWSDIIDIVPPVSASKTVKKVAAKVASKPPKKTASKKVAAKKPRK